MDIFQSSSHLETFNKRGVNFFNSCVKCKATSNRQKYEECFRLYDVNGDGYLCREEFQAMCKDVFVDPSLETGQTLTSLADQMLKLLDTDQDGKLSKEEFKVCWCYWFKQIFDPVSALVIVDVQNDFIEGSLALSQCPAGQDGRGVIPIINHLLDTVNFEVVAYSKDWHPKDHISFVENIHLRPLHHTSQVKSAHEAKPLDTVVFESNGPMEQKLWPTHCVQGTWGAELHPDLKVVDNSYIVEKGISSHVDSYSSFWDNNKWSKTNLLSLLSKHRVTDVYCCGLALDVCVGFTAQHSLDHGFRTVLVDDASRGVCLNDIHHTCSKLKTRGGVVASSAQVKDMVEGRIRNAELGLQAAVNVNVALQLLDKAKAR